MMMAVMMMVMIVTVYLSVSVGQCEGAGEEELIYTQDTGQGGGQKYNTTAGTRRQNNKMLLLNLRGAIETITMSS